MTRGMAAGTSPGQQALSWQVGPRECGANRGCPGTPAAWSFLQLSQPAARCTPWSPRRPMKGAAQPSGHAQEHHLRVWWFQNRPGGVSMALQVASLSRPEGHVGLPNCGIRSSAGGLGKLLLVLSRPKDTSTQRVARCEPLQCVCQPGDRPHE